MRWSIKPRTESQRGKRASATSRKTGRRDGARPQGAASPRPTGGRVEGCGTRHAPPSSQAREPFPGGGRGPAGGRRRRRAVLRYIDLPNWVPAFRPGSAMCGDSRCPTAPAPTPAKAGTQSGDALANDRPSSHQLSQLGPGLRRGGAALRTFRAVLHAYICPHRREPASSRADLVDADASPSDMTFDLARPIAPRAETIRCHQPV
jgi:hypothetical protein